MLHCRYDSSLTMSQKDRVITKLGNNEIDVLFLTPEMLLSKNFLKNVPQLNAPYVPPSLADAMSEDEPPSSSESDDELWSRVPLLVIDEVHCISSWGHDFRLSYFRNMKVLQTKAWFCNSRVLGTSATVSDSTLIDIQSVLDRRPTIVRGDLFRPNMSIRKLESGSAIDRKNWLVRHLRKSKSSRMSCHWHH